MIHQVCFFDCLLYATRLSFDHAPRAGFLVRIVLYGLPPVLFSRVVLPALDAAALPRGLIAVLVDCVYAGKKWCFLYVVFVTEYKGELCLDMTLMLCACI